MKVAVDPTRCVGVGICEALAPDLFSVGDDAIVDVLHPDIVPSARENDARNAVSDCPSGALRLE